MTVDTGEIAELAFAIDGTKDGLAATGAIKICSLKISMKGVTTTTKEVTLAKQITIQAT